MKTSVEKLDIQDGDVLLVGGRVLSYEEAQRFCDLVMRSEKKGVTVFFMSDGMDIKVMNEAAMNAAGWYREPFITNLRRMVGGPAVVPEHESEG